MRERQEDAVDDYLEVADHVGPADRHVVDAQPRLDGVARVRVRDEEALPPNERREYGSGLHFDEIRVH